VAEIFQNLDLFFPACSIEKLLSSVLNGSASIHDHSYPSKGTLAQLSALHIHRSLTGRERFTRGEGAILTAERQVLEGQLMLLRGTV